MATPLLHQMRRTSGFMRATALTLIVTFGGLVTAPAVAAVRQGGAPAAVSLPDSDEARFSRAMLRVSTTLARLEKKLSANKPGKDERAVLNQLTATIKQLDKAVQRNFADVDALIKAKKLPEVIQKRQDEAVATYRQELARTLESLSAIEQASTDDERLAKVKAARQHLDGLKLRRSHQPFDPNDLNPSFKADPNNKPKTTKEEFTQAGFVGNPLPKLAALGDFTFDSLPGADDPAYLGETPEVTLTQAIRDKATELDNDPVKIYHWVRNNVEWLPSWGANQSADLTLSTLSGNSMDIASLTIALLRASGIPARYVQGTIDVPTDKFVNWVGDFDTVFAAQEYASVGGIPTGTVTSGGQITKVRMEHVWVEAAIDFYPSRGAINRDADAWVEMDPSYKQYEYLQGVDAAALAGIDGNALTQSFADSGTVNEQEGWVQGLDQSILKNAGTLSQQKLNDYIANNMTDPTVSEVIGERRTIIHEYPTLPSSLPNRIVVKGSRYAELPNGLRRWMSFSFGRDIFGYPDSPLTLPWASVNNERITLSFRPATEADSQALQALLPEGDLTDLSQLPFSIPSYLVSVIPELKLQGKVVKSGSPMKLGEELDFVFQVKTPLETQAPYTYKVSAGAYLAIAAIGQGVGVDRVNDAKRRLEMTKTALESQDQVRIAALTGDELVGDPFHAGILGYFAEYAALGHILALQQHTSHSLAIGYGSFGSEPNVDYFFGFPRAIEPGGAVMNIRIGDYVATRGNDNEGRVLFRQQLGVLSSALEHKIPEQMFLRPDNAGDAISAVKALNMAAAQGQKIYHITSENMATALPNIHHDTLVMDEIRAAIAVGKEVTTHTDAVSIPGWSGAGYVIIDPDTGLGAYKIGGGTNGGWLSGLIMGAALALLVLAPFVGGPIGVGVTAFFLAAIQIIVPALLVFAFWLSLQSDEYRQCFVGGLVLGFTTVLGLGNLPSWIARALVLAGFAGTLTDNLGSSPAACGVNL